MNNVEQAKKQIIEFLDSDKKCMLMTGTHKHDKPKLIMSILNEYFEKKQFLFRTNSMQNITLDNTLGWANVKKQPKSGERIEVGKNSYECDSLHTCSTWHRTNSKFLCAIVYPIDALCRSKKLDAINDLFQYKSISKIFLVSCTDIKHYDYPIFSEHVERCVVYDVDEEDVHYQ